MSPQKTGSLYRFLVDEVVIRPRLSLKALASFWPVILKVIRGKQLESELPWQGEEAVLEPGRDPLYQTWILQPRNGNWDLIVNYFHQFLEKLDY